MILTSRRIHDWPHAVAVPFQPGDRRAWCHDNIGPQYDDDGAARWYGPMSASALDPELGNMTEIWVFIRREHAMQFDMVWG